jgi:hypothetical protein
MQSVSPVKTNQLLSRITALERENVELQEELLTLKKQIMSMKMEGHSRPSTPVAQDTPDIGSLEKTVDALKGLVTRTIDELRQYRVTESEVHPNSSETINEKQWSVVADQGTSVRSDMTSSLSERGDLKAPPDPDEFDTLFLTAGEQARKINQAVHPTLNPQPTSVSTMKLGINQAGWGGPQKNDPEFDLDDLLN